MMISLYSTTAVDDSTKEPVITELYGALSGNLIENPLNEQVSSLKHTAIDGKFFLPMDNPTHINMASITDDNKVMFEEMDLNKRYQCNISYPSELDKFDAQKFHDIIFDKSGRRIPIETCNRIIKRMSELIDKMLDFNRFRPAISSILKNGGFDSSGLDEPINSEMFLYQDESQEEHKCELMIWKSSNFKEITIFVEFYSKYKECGKQDDEYIFMNSDGSKIYLIYNIMQQYPAIRESMFLQLGKVLTEEQIKKLRSDTHWSDRMARDDLLEMQLKNGEISEDQYKKASNEIWGKSD